MRIYAPIDITELENLMAGQKWTPSIFFGATPEFMAAHPELDEEECEYLLSISAAEAALESNQPALVLAAESDSAEELGINQIECVFVCTPSDGESDIELAWFGLSEISHHMHEWTSK